MRVRGEEGGPGVGAHKEGTEQLEVCERGQGGGEGVHGGRVEVPAEV